MENSILNSIGHLAKTKNITLERIQFKIDKFLPEAFYEVVLENFNKINPNYNDHNKIENFYLNFDSNNNPYFEFISNDNFSRVVIIIDNILYSELPPARILRESYLIESAKHTDMVKNSLILNSIPENFRKRFLSDINISETFNNILYKFKEYVISYIEYLQQLKNESIEKIYFTEADSVSNLGKTKRINPRPSTDRKYEEIPFTEREKILNEYSPDEQFEAKARNTDSVYIVKVYNIKSKNKYKLILEPKEGTKYTKIVHIDQKKLSKAEVKQIVIDTLQLNRNDISNRDDITRHSHTTISEYRKLLEYVLNDNNIGLNASARYNIDNANKKR